jgi:predicted dehydrogenase/threonine dehydrogenase-like Zn-dependent dehydrogenase
MRQILMNSDGAFVARVPRPALDPGSVLVRVHYSLISVGTEIAPLKAPLADAAEDASPVEKGVAYASLATRYLRASWRDPHKAARRVASIARRRLAALKPASAPRLSPVVGLGELQWTKDSAVSFAVRDGRIEVSTDDSPAGYQALTQPLTVPEGQVPTVRVSGTVHIGAIGIGLLNETRDKWIGARTFDAGRFEDLLIFEPGSSHAVTVVITTAGAGRSRATIDHVEVSMAPASQDGVAPSELNQQGWNIGYSVAGEVVAVGERVTDLVAGDRVACAGAGQANHADYVSVKRNLVCRVPEACSTSAAASATIGSIAMQGVRRASPQLGERIAVIGLGLIGQITAQLLRSAGCTVIGLDLDPARVARALSLGMDAGTSDAEAFKALVRDRTYAAGADKTLVTAATRSDAVVNLAIDVTRMKGAVVLVGDVGLHLQRPTFYRKELDLLMSTSYGPGRYDPGYEVDGHDYPLPYVRWTLNRNMQAYLELIASGRLNIDALVDRVIAVDEAPAAYKSLAGDAGTPPLGVLIRYPEDTRALPDPADASRIVIRGHRPARTDAVNYALVGAGAFGMGMLVPQMKKRKDRFFLRGVVSRNTTQGGNFARENAVEVLASELKTVLDDPGFQLMVIATRHHEHAAQVIDCLRAGKHVFVEKPLAITWEELDRVVEAYEALGEKPLVMVGFNRRFSPAIAEIRKATANRRAPLVIEYRLNGGYIPLDSWVQGAQGGGRNIGEACHMYDVFRSLTGAAVRSIAATSIDPSSLPYLRSDNFAATIGYQDGSIANLVYTALGPKTGMGKERIEVFCDGDAFVVDDFKKLTRAGDGSVLWQSGEPDKGHAEEFSLFGDALASGGPSPIPFEEIVETTAVALHVEDLLHRREDSNEASPQTAE